VTTDALKFDNWLYGERTWRRCGERSHMTRDGRHIVWVEWQTDCVICGAPIVITATPHARTIAKCNSFRRATCGRHGLTDEQRLTLRDATPERRRVLFEQLKADMLEADKAAKNP
jgi:hypothetical protein